MTSVVCPRDAREMSARCPRDVREMSAKYSMNFDWLQSYDVKFYGVRTPGGHFADTSRTTLSRGLLWGADTWRTLGGRLADNLGWGLLRSCGHLADTWRTLGGHGDTWRTIASLLDLTHYIRVKGLI